MKRRFVIFQLRRRSKAARRCVSIDGRINSMLRCLRIGRRDERSANIPVSTKRSEKSCEFIGAEEIFLVIFHRLVSLAGGSAILTIADAASARDNVVANDIHVFHLRCPNKETALRGMRELIALRPTANRSIFL